MPELRRSSSIGARAKPSPMTRDDVTAPLYSDNHVNPHDDDDDDSSGRDRCRLANQLKLLDDNAKVYSHKFKILLYIITILAFAAMFTVYSVNNSHINAPYLCTKDGGTLHCPNLKESPSLWENPLPAATSWKPCAERRNGSTSDLPEAHETTGYIFIQAEGGLNQQRIAICNAVAVAKIMNATLILPNLKQDRIWKDQTKFEDVFDVDHFIDYLKDDVRIVRDIPSWFTDKSDLLTNIRLTVKNIPKYASAQFYINNVLPRIKEKRVMALKPFVDRLGYENVPQEINRLRCRVNYHALKFLPEIEEMADQLVARMRNRTGSPNPFL